MVGQLSSAMPFVEAFAIIFKISFADPLVAQPPFTPLLNFVDQSKTFIYLTLDNYRFLTEDRKDGAEFLERVDVPTPQRLLCRDEEVWINLRFRFEIS